MNDLEKLEYSEADNIGKVLISLICAFPHFPKEFTANNNTVKYNSLDTSMSVGIFPLSNSMYTNKYIDGSYDAVFSFQLVFRSSKKTNTQTLTAESTLRQLAEWLCSCDITFTDKSKTLVSISQTSQVFANNIDERNIDYIVNMELIYSDERR